VYSLGSNNDFSFETAMLAATPCEVHTFDCTSEAPKAYMPRHAFHKVCLGDAVDATHGTLASITAGLRHSHISLLKMDIEGGEFSVFAAFHRAVFAAAPGAPRAAVARVLPDQISFELHNETLSAGHDANVVWPQLADLGYVIVSREDNPECGICAEFTVVRAFEPTKARRRR